MAAMMAGRDITRSGWSPGLDSGKFDMALRSCPNQNTHLDNQYLGDDFPTLVVIEKARM